MTVLNRILALLVLLSLFSSASAQKVQDTDITGTWLTADKTGEITIYEDKDRYYGKITAGTSDEKFDVHNPDKARRSDPLLGMVIIRGLKFNAREMVWEEGTVYDPKSGKTYSCIFKLIDENTLKITGYVGFSWIGRSEVWTRIK